jgi:hypothetical protein
MSNYWGVSCCKDFGLSLDAPWLSIAPPVLWLFLPWVWVCIEIHNDGGCWIEVLNPRKIGGFGPRLMFHGGAIGRRRWQWTDER